MDLNNHLFEQMERLNDDDLSDEQLEKETKRAKTMVGISTQIINNANLIFQDCNGLVVEDAKGMKTPVYQMKKRMKWRRRYQP